MDPSHTASDSVTVRCSFCLTLNAVDLAKASDRPRCGSCERPILLDRPLKVAQDDFERTVLGSPHPVIVDFYADWCAPCKFVAPVMDDLAQKHVGTLLVAKVDTDQAPDVSARFGIRSIPTLILFRDGEEVARSIGFMPDEIQGLVRSALT